VPTARVSDPKTDSTSMRMTQWQWRVRLGSCVSGTKTAKVCICTVLLNIVRRIATIISHQHLTLARRRIQIQSPPILLLKLPWRALLRSGRK
jgi:hypothetical protein